jgi:hypothetical protein
MNIQEISYRKSGGMTYILSFLLLVVLTRFFDFLYIPRRLLFYVGITILLYFYFKSKQDSYKNKLWIGIIWLMVLGSILYSHFIHGQPFRGVAESSYFAMGLASFCIFDTLRLSYKDSFKLIKSFSILFCICYLVQATVYPTELFAGVKDEFSVNENLFRMRMTCSACCYCLFFLGINDYMIKKKLISLFYVLLGLLPIIIMGFRSLVALSLLFAIYIFAWHLWKSRLQLIIYSIFLLLFVFVSFQIPIVQEKFEEMKSRQESEQTFDNEDYVRYVSLAYYTEVTTKAEMMIGGGVPLVPPSLTSRNHYVSKFCKGYQMKLYWNDLGLIGFGYIFGFPSVILITFLVFRTALRSREQQLLFIRVTLLTIYLGTIFTSQELYRSGNFLFIGLLIYTEYIYHKEKQIHSELLKKKNT